MLRPERIEDGFLVLAMMPSLHCENNCPHCFISDSLRESKDRLSEDEILKYATSIREYYDTSSLEVVNLFFYWYGGEPTDLGIDYVQRVCTGLKKVFSDQKYHVHQIFLTSLCELSEDWIQLFKAEFDSKVQTSHDFDLRTAEKLSGWEANVRKLVQSGIDVTTLTVTNSYLPSAEDVYAYFKKLGVSTSSFLMMTKNEKNSDVYSKLRMSANDYAEFLIRFATASLEDQEAVTCGEVIQVAKRASNSDFVNSPEQTLFLMPNSALALSDYTSEGHEFFFEFGSLNTETFEDIVASQKRRRYLQRQSVFARNRECLSCRNNRLCLIEFWKTNSDPTGCFGASKFVDWLLSHPELEKLKAKYGSTLCI